LRRRKRKKRDKNVREEKKQINGRRRRKIYFQKLVYMNLIQKTHSQNFQISLQLPENIGSF